MHRKQPSLSALQDRKRMLVAEAEAQRAALRCDLEIIKSGLHNFGQHAKSAGSIASTATLVVAGFSALSAVRALRREGKVSFISRLLAGARLASTVWVALSARKR